MQLSHQRCAAVRAVAWPPSAQALRDIPPSRRSFRRAAGWGPVGAGALLARDARNRSEAQRMEAIVSDIMTTPAFALEREHTLNLAQGLMRFEHIRHLP